MTTYSAKDKALVKLAYLVADLAHAGQTRRDGVTPYLTHIEAVMKRAPQDAISQAVAAGHDILEDTAYTTTFLETHGLPPEVIRGVEALTRRPAETYAQFIERIKVTDDGRWIPIKVADILSNLADSPTPGQILRYAKALLTLVDP
jgi:(p)ppGpp synthase/HD superfamily hydrolase